jgi:hypothetical protein
VSSITADVKNTGQMPAVTPKANEMHKVRGSNPLRISSFRIFSTSKTQECTIKSYTRGLHELAAIETQETRLQLSLYA